MEGAFTTDVWTRQLTFVCFTDLFLKLNFRTLSFDGKFQRPKVKVLVLK